MSVGSADSHLGTEANGGQVRRLLAPSVVVVLVSYLIVDRGVELGLPEMGSVAQVGVEATLMAVTVALMLWVLVLRPWALAGRAADAARAARSEREHLFQLFVSRLTRAFEMAATEAACYDVVERGLRLATPDVDADLMLADSSEAHLAVVAGTSTERGGCAVVSPGDCPAVRRSQPLSFASSDELDACLHLLARTASADSGSGVRSGVGGVCVPVSVAGRSIGVLHATTPRPPTNDELEHLRVVADRAGSRIGMLRVLRQTTLQAATDPLTGLMNRRSMDSHVRDITRAHETFTVVMADLDHFKKINDVHGHDTGDRALRLYARTLAAGVREQDRVCRYGGEEFLVVLPGATAEQAVSVLERIGAALQDALADASLPAFTVSYGVADVTDAADFTSMVAAADHALLAAKRAGRDRVVLAHSSHPLTPVTVDPSADPDQVPNRPGAGG